MHLGCCGARDGALQCVLVPAVDRVVVHVFGDCAHPHPHGALG